MLIISFFKVSHFDRVRVKMAAASLSSYLPIHKVLQDHTRLSQRVRHMHCHLSKTTFVQGQKWRSVARQNGLGISLRGKPSVRSGQAFIWAGMLSGRRRDLFGQGIDYRACRTKPLTLAILLICFASVLCIYTPKVWTLEHWVGRGWAGMPPIQARFLPAVEAVLGPQRRWAA